MKFPWKISWHQVAISVLIGFFLGAAFGQWNARTYFHPHGKHGVMKAKMVERLSCELRLTAVQKEQVAAILEAKRPQMLALKEEVRPKFEALRNSTQAEIRAILNPDQQKKFDEMNAGMEKRWKEHKKFSGS